MRLGGVDPGERPPLQHQDLSPAAFLGRRPKIDHAAAQFGHDGAERHGRGRHPGAHQVVAAGMAQARQRVVLGDEPDGRARCRAARSGGDRGGDLRDAALDGKPVALEHLRDPGDGLVLLEPCLGVGMDPERQVARLRVEPVQRFERPCLEGREI